ncbi:MAG: NAD(P)H-hydrate dehydratase [Candidatus Hydrogenedentota bacterium]
MKTSTITLETARELTPARPPDGHKGTFGHVFAIAGALGFSGAAKLAGEGASRSGTGLVTLGVPSSLAQAMAADLLDIMYHPLPATEEGTLAHAALEPAQAFARDKSAVVLGPGLTQHPGARAFVHDFVAACEQPLVVDADGLNNLAGNTAVLKRRSVPAVLTPHPGEMARLTGLDTRAVQQDRLGVAQDFADTYNSVVVLKGYETVVAAPGRECAVNSTGNAGLAKGGAGDVLGGLIGGLLAQGMKPFGAARLGVFIHGLAGDEAADQHTQRGMTVRDLLAALPQAWKLVEQKGTH